MEEKKCNDEYFARCDKLYSLIQKAYIDQSLLRSIEIYNKAKEKENLRLGQRSAYVLTHICELIKSDLALTIWKIYCDDHRDSNTIQHLNTFMHKKKIGKNVSLDLGNKYNSICTDLRKIRKQTLAHDDVTKDKIHINISLLFEMLEKLTEKYNALCDESIDYRVKQVISKDISVVNFNFTFGFWNMIQGVSIPPDDSPQEDLQDV